MRRELTRDQAQRTGIFWQRLEDCRLDSTGSPVSESDPRIVRFRGAAHRALGRFESCNEDFGAVCGVQLFVFSGIA